MKKVLVVYGTTDGHTAKVAREIGHALRMAGASVRVLEASGTLAGPEGFAAVIVAASLHAGRYQADVRRWVQRHAAPLANVPGAFVSVCLAVRDPAAAPAVAAIMSRFAEACGWRPTVMKPVAGALLYRRYGWIKRWMMKRISARHHGDTDTSRDYEYTDWEDLHRFATDFAHALEATTAARGAA